MDYAHFDTSAGERKSPAAQFNVPAVSPALAALRKSAFSRLIPTADDETLCFLLAQVSALRPSSILELGTATGISGIAMLQAAPSAVLDTVERDERFYAEAVSNFGAAGLSHRVNAHLGDAAEFIAENRAAYDLIFMDCAKVQYVKYLPRLVELLNVGGALIADDVLLFGYVSGETPVPPKRAALVRHMREFLDALRADGRLVTSVLNIGDGVSFSVKKNN